MTTAGRLAALLHEIEPLHGDGFHHYDCSDLAARLRAAGVGFPADPDGDRGVGGECLDCGAGTGHYDRGVGPRTTAIALAPERLALALAVWWADDNPMPGEPGHSWESVAALLAAECADPKETTL